MEEIGKLGYSSWNSNTFDFSASDIDNDQLMELFEVVEKNILDSNGDEFPSDLNTIVVINLKGCKEVDKLPEALVRCYNLKEINLVDTGIKEVPELFKKMDGVKVILNE